METWKKIPGWDGYEASDLGHIRSYKKKEGKAKWIIASEPQRILRQCVTGNGYFFVSLSKNGVTKVLRVARLILLAFVGECPPMMEVCHNDGNSKNNTLPNLRYDTRKANTADRIRHYQERGNGHFNESQVLYIRTRIADKTMSAQALANEFGVSKHTIRKICTGTTYQKFAGPIVDVMPRAHKCKARGANKYRGVSAHQGKWRAQIWIGGRGGKPIGLGIFDEEIDAARVYDEKAKKLHGCFASLNFPESGS